MYFDKIFIIGSGSICINIAKSLLLKDVNLTIITYKEHNVSALSMFCSNRNIKNFSFENKDNLTEFLLNESAKSLIISANNTYLFPKKIIDKNNFKIINFHNALLPKHRGINAPSWTIFEQDDVAGITWHIVNENIDDGDVIIQKEIKLNNTETSIILVKKLMNLAYIAYKEIEENILNWNLQTTKMKMGPYQLHYAKDIPNQGIYNEDWPFEKKSAFLRSLDWGCIQQFPKPIIKTAQNIYVIENYQIENGTIDLVTKAL